MDRNRPPKEPERIEEEHRQAQDQMSKAERNKNFGATQQRNMARYDKPQNWYRKAPHDSKK